MSFINCLYVCQKNHIHRIIFPCSFLFKTQRCILMENIWLEVVSISHIMRVKKKCLMFWLNPIILNLLMRLSCTCSKFKILEKSDVMFFFFFCIVPALCFRNLIKFLCQSQTDFSTFNFSLLPCTLPRVWIYWPFRCILIRCTCMVH